MTDLASSVISRETDIDRLNDLGSLSPALRQFIVNTVSRISSSKEYTVTPEWCFQFPNLIRIETEIKVDTPTVSDLKLFKRFTACNFIIQSLQSIMFFIRDIGPEVISKEYRFYYKTGTIEISKGLVRTNEILALDMHEILVELIGFNALIGIDMHPMSTQTYLLLRNIPQEVYIRTDDELIETSKYFGDSVHTLRPNNDYVITGDIDVFKAFTVLENLYIPIENTLVDAILAFAPSLRLVLLRDKPEDNSIATAHPNVVFE